MTLRSNSQKEGLEDHSFFKPSYLKCRLDKYSMHAAMKTKNLLNLALLTSLILSISCSSNSDKSTANGNVSTTRADVEDEQILAAKRLIEKMPDSADGYNRLATAYIRRARLTGDFSLYQKAELAVNKALELEPDDFATRKLQAVLHIIFHRFHEAKQLAQNLLTQAEDTIIYGVLTDANIELGEYEQAIESAQKMMNLKPNLEAYSRTAILRSLHGQVESAIEAMRTAASIADPLDTEVKAWCYVKLGDEYFKVGNFNEAEKNYDIALKILPDYYLALSAKGKLLAAKGDFTQAIDLYNKAQNKVPIVETVIALGDLYYLQGDQEKAKLQYDLAEVIEEKLGRTDMRRLALLWADHSVRLDEALKIIESEYQKRKDIYTADIYAWVLYKRGEFVKAKELINEAMRLKTKDARIFYHAGMIENSLGNKQQARKYLKAALDLNPAFDLIQAKIAKDTLEELKKS